MVISSMAATVSVGVGVRFRVAATEQFGVAYRSCTLYAGTISYVGIEFDLVLSCFCMVDGSLCVFAKSLKVSEPASYGSNQAIGKVLFNAAYLPHL